MSPQMIQIKLSGSVSKFIENVRLRGDNVLTGEVMHLYSFLEANINQMADAAVTLGISFADAPSLRFMKAHAIYVEHVVKRLRERLASVGLKFEDAYPDGEWERFEAIAGSAKMIQDQIEDIRRGRNKPPTKDDISIGLVKTEDALGLKLTAAQVAASLAEQLGMDVCAAPSTFAPLHHD